MAFNFNKYVNDFVGKYKGDVNGRYKSYDHCRKCFLDNKDNPVMYDLIILHLYAYLASWGMLRNSFLLQKDYLFNKPVVEILCDKKYSQLVNFDPFAQNIVDDLKLIMELKEEIINYYTIGKTYIDPETGKTITIKNVTDTLVSKIILGTLGCVPAYDKYLVKGLRKSGIVGTFNLKSLNGIINCVKPDKAHIDIVCNDLDKSNNYKNLYTPMKIIDAYFWEYGY